MKAKEYFTEYNNIKKEKGGDYALVECLMNMFKEVKVIQKSRNAKSDSSVVSILNETNQKANSFIRMINKTIDNKKEGFIKIDAFKIFVKLKMKKLAYLLNWD